MMDRWNDGWGAGQWLAMGLMMLVFWAAVAAVIIALFRRTGPTRDQSAEPPHRDAERILSERFARGDIDEEEFVRRRDALRR